MLPTPTYPFIIANRHESH